MSSDDLTRDIADNEDGNTTQPTIEAVFRLLNEVKVQVENLNARLDTTNARIDEVESRLARDIEGVNTRVLEGFREVSNKIDILNRSRLQTEADYLGLQKRVTDLESKAS